MLKLLLCALPFAYAKVKVHRWDTMMLIVQKIIRFLLFLGSCLMAPFVWWQCLKKRKRLPPIKNHLLLLSATEIARRIRGKEISSEEVVRAYVERCKEVNPILNAIVESRFDPAIEEAKKVDEYLSRTTKTEEELAREMPLLGVPMTIKESIGVQGMSHSVGVKKKIPAKASEDAVVVKMVREAGAIILLVSNTPELCLFWETFNKVTGCTWNPYDTRRVSGGSSGGEAALVSSAASILSLSSDIAGSARVPAMYCGIFGHKPSALLVPIEGHKPASSDKNWPNYFAIGTVVRYAEDFPLIMKIISQTEDARQSFDQKVSLKDTKFYYLEDYGGLPDSADREIKEAIQRLKKHIETTYGVKVQKAQINDMKYACEVGAYNLLTIEVEGIKEEVNGAGTAKVWLELLRFIFCASSHTFPPILYGLTSWIAKKLPESFGNKMRDTKIALKKELEDLLGDNGVLIIPTFTTSATYRNKAYFSMCNFTYTMIYSVLGMPATQCPMGLNGNGLPIGLQIVSKAGNDHLTIAVARKIEEAFGGWQQPPSTEISV